VWIDTVTFFVGDENLERMSEAIDQVTRSGGADSMPICGNMRAPVFWAVASYFLSILATKGTSPVTSP
jgi:hypothetical protein